jgi:hypothetical protein
LDGEAVWVSQHEHIRKRLEAEGFAEAEVVFWNVQGVDACHAKRRPACRSLTVSDYKIQKGHTDILSKITELCCSPSKR